MALRSIRTEGDEVLRKETKKVTVFDRRLQMLVEDMFDTMYDANGVGLAGPQVGVLKQVVVIDTGEEGEQLVLINPEIVETQGEAIEPEGCLSIPGKQGTVKRPTMVRVKAQDINGEPFEAVGEDFLAKAMCHEIDHLHGILYSDKVIDWLKTENTQ